MTGTPRPSYECAQEPLPRLLDEAHEGRIQVPEFQRELSLDDEWITSLLASVSLGYPIGVFQLLQAGDPGLRFSSRPVTGAPSSSDAPERLLIDGQYRLTSLYQVLASGQAVHTRDGHGNPVRRWYYLDIVAATDPAADRDEAIISLPETRQGVTPQRRPLDLSTPEREWEERMFPLRLVFGDAAELRHWQHGFVTSENATATEAAVDGEDDAIRDQLMDRFTATVLTAFENYLVPTIVLGSETTRWSVRVHGGPDGRTLSDRFRVADDS